MPTVALLAALFLAGCAGPAGVTLPDLGDWEQRQRTLAALDEWTFNGRAAVRTEDDGFNAKLRWLQSGVRYQATLSGPLGIGTVRIEGDDQQAVLINEDGEQSTFHDIEAELQHRYGWTIPVRSLRYWALGIPDPSLPADTKLDEAGRLAELKQGGWQVRVSKYGAAAGQVMPSRVRAGNGSAVITLVIDRWVFFE